MESEKLLKRTERTLQAMAEEANRLTPKQQGLLRLLYNTPSPAQPGTRDRGALQTHIGLTRHPRC